MFLYRIASICCFVCWSISCVASTAAETPLTARVVQVEKIWDQAPHNAFTDLARWRDRWYCAFREGEGHAKGNGKLRVLVSTDGASWESSGLIGLAGYDLRDAALAVTPDDRLMVLGGAQQTRAAGRETGTFVSFAAIPGQFSAPEIVVPLGRWLWRVTWHQGRAYGVSYATPAGKPFSSLLVTDDGRKFESLAPQLLDAGGWPTEARIRFGKDGTAYCLHRRDEGSRTAYWGTSAPPYKEWTWTDLGRYFGGPNFIELPTGRWIGAGRLHGDEGTTTSLTYIDAEHGRMTPLVDLPSGGDTSYPGMVWHDGQLWVSYYASHEDKTSIYLARIEFEEHSRSESVATEAIDIGSRRELFVDRHLIDRLEGAALQLQRPIDAGPVLKFDAPWEGRFSGYATLIKDEDLYRLYYRGLPEAGADGSDKESTCYAESENGIDWKKPRFNFHPTPAGEKTNRVVAGAAPYTHNFSPFLDRNPEAKPTERFKAIGGTARSGLHGYVSADGTDWKKIRDEPVFSQSGWVFDSQNVCFWSVAERQYLLYYRVVPDGVRAIARATSKDFIHWSEPVVMTYSDTDSTQPSHQLYTNQTQPYFRAPHIYLSTAARFMPGRRVLSDEQAKEIGVDPKYYGDTSDAVLMSSRGDDRYDRTFLGALIRPGIGAENWVSRTNYPALNIVPTSATQMSLYVNQNYGQPSSHLRRYVFRMDGLAALHGPYGGGAMTTKPFKFDGHELALNFATSAAGSVRIELQDATGEPIEGFAQADCDPLIGNEISRVVTWKGSRDVTQLSGQPIRMLVELDDADLFSFKFQ